MNFYSKILLALTVIAVSACSRSPEEQCISSKTDALKTALPYIMAMMKGARGMAVPGRIEADNAIKKIQKVCGNPNYSLNDLLNESELTNSGFVLKKTNEKTSQILDIKSSDIVFSSAKIGGKVRDFYSGDKLEFDGGPYFFTANKALIGYEYDENIKYEMQGYDQKVESITYQCKDSTFPASTGKWSIEGIDCQSNVNSLEGANWKKLCRVHTFSNINQPYQLLFLKNNAFITVSSNEVETYGIYSNKNYFDFSYRTCDQADNLKAEAIKKGFESIGDYLVFKSNEKK